ncbi:MAG: hypothetical protein P0Y53_01175 [Candidatus Pseudobacter hemicellulosilyticus]|uniref:Uncharacterized protein n=1 Tax=Candidatus Pseudobacter hemicellulosilyticus TaxID=3121375 RepID=A0AAJ5WRP9_9BACT|nr:MAG: hypothetical protein P0Y53_01175 [Pseudobacter sp.]
MMEGNGKWENGKQQLAKWLQSKSSKTSLGIQKVILVAVVLLVGAYCGALLVEPVINRLDKGGLSLSPKIERNEREVIERRIRGLEHMLDSLGRSPAGRKKRDSILRENPGLPDSIGKWKGRLKSLGD